MEYVRCQVCQKTVFSCFVFPPWSQTTNGPQPQKARQQKPKDFNRNSNPNVLHAMQQTQRKTAVLKASVPPSHRLPSNPRAGPGQNTRNSVRHFQHQPAEDKKKYCSKHAPSNRMRKTKNLPERSRGRARSPPSPSTGVADPRRNPIT